MYPHQGRRQKNFQGGKPKNNKKDRKMALLCLSMGRGGNGKNTEKQQKKDRKIAIFSLYLPVPCMKIQGGHGPRCRRP